MHKTILLSLAAIGISITACKKEALDVVDCTGTTPTYTANIKAIMDKDCATSGCHSSSAKRSGYDLSSYVGVSAAGKSQAFLGAIQHKSGYSKMPKGESKLSDADVKTITCWVQNNMPE